MVNAKRFLGVLFDVKRIEPCRLNNSLHMIGFYKDKITAHQIGFCFRSVAFTGINSKPIKDEVGMRFILVIKRVSCRCIKRHDATRIFPVFCKPRRKFSVFCDEKRLRFAGF